MKIIAYLFMLFTLGVFILFLSFLSFDAYKFYTYKTKPYQEQNSIKIVTSADDNFIIPLGVFLTSIAMNTKTPVEISILTRGFNEKHALFLQQLKEKLTNIKISQITIDKEIDFKDFSIKDRWNETIYYRYLIINHPAFQNMDKILYLDADIVVFKDLGEYWQINLGDNFMAGRRDLNAYQNYYRPVCPFKTDLYVNGGSLLLNLKKMRTENIQPLLFETTYKYNDIFYYGDQDVMNFLFKDKIIELSPKYNGNVLLEAPFAKIVYHYLGNGKPWKTQSTDYHEWYKYQAYQNAILNNKSFPLTNYFNYIIDKLDYYFNFFAYTYYFSSK